MMDLIRSLQEEEQRMLSKSANIGKVTPPPINLSGGFSLAATCEEIEKNLLIGALQCLGAAYGVPSVTYAESTEKQDTVVSDSDSEIYDADVLTNSD